MRFSRFQVYSMLALLALGGATPTSALAQNESFTIQKLFTQQTAVVLRVNLKQLDPAVLEQWFLSRVKAIKGGEGADVQLEPKVASTLQMLRNLRDAGVTDMWFVLDVPVMEPAGNQPGARKDFAFLMCVPLGATVQAAKVEIMLRNNGLATAREYGAIIGTDEATRDALRRRKAVARADLDAPIAQSKASAMAIAVGLASPELRRMMTRADAAPVGQTTLDRVLASIDWTVWTIESLTPNGPQMGRAMVRTTNPADAAATRDALATLLDDLRKQMPAEFGQLIARAKPTLTGTMIAFDLAWGPADFERLIPLVSGKLASTRLEREMAASSASMRELLLCCTLYMDAHRETWPDSLAEAVTIDPNAAAKKDTLLRNPRSKSPDAGYVYLKPREKIPTAQRILMYELLEPSVAKLNVGFADGHVEPLTREELAKRLADQGLPALRTLSK